MCGASAEIGIVAQTRGAARALAASPSGIGKPLARIEAPRRDCASQPAGPKRPQVYFPSVMIGIDRAAE